MPQLTRGPHSVISRRGRWPRQYEGRRLPGGGRRRGGLLLAPISLLLVLLHHRLVAFAWGLHSPLMGPLLLLGRRSAAGIFFPIAPIVRLHEDDIVIVLMMGVAFWGRGGGPLLRRGTGRWRGRFSFTAWNISSLGERETERSCAKILNFCSKPVAMKISKTRTKIINSLTHYIFL